MKAKKTMKAMKAMKAMKGVVPSEGEAQPVVEKPLSGGWKKLIHTCADGRKLSNFKCPDNKPYTSLKDARIRGKCTEAWCKK